MATLDPVQVLLRHWRAGGNTQVLDSSSSKEERRGSAYCSRCLWAPRGGRDLKL